MTRILLVGHGRMGVLVEQLAPEYGCDIAGIVTEETGVAGIAAAPESTEVAIDFTTANAVAANMEALAERRINVVIGTTGWHAQEAAVRAVAERHAAPHILDGLEATLTRSMWFPRYRPIRFEPPAAWALQIAWPREVVT